MWCRYLLWFAHEHVEFRNAEMQSILSLFNIPIKYAECPSIEKPYWIVELPSEECVKKLASRSILLKNCIELWSLAKSISLLHENLKNAICNKSDKWILKEDSDSKLTKQICPSSLIEACTSPNKSFKLKVETFCKHFTMKEKVSKIEKFDYLPFEGPVQLKDPDNTLMYIEFYGVDPNNVPTDPYDVFFGKWIADGQREVIQHHSLKKRHFIGNTSMDAQLALIMANQAKVQTGDFVLDPFVGSGSLLVAASHFGGYVWGSDIDFMMLHGRTRPTRVGQKERAKEESIRGNMYQYDIASKYLDVIVSDFSLPLWQARLKFDAIITDPPYGVREPTEKIGIVKENYRLLPEQLSNHVPSKVDYILPHLYADLLRFAAEHLIPGKRLVCWYPVVRSEYKEEELPCHPCLTLVSNSEQVLSQMTARRLLTFERRDVLSPNLCVTLTPTTAMYNFRETYFAAGETSRRQRRERRAEAVTAAAKYKAMRKDI
ncbi:hypothetical protein ACJJTC_004883 [Scirpophaga incertulas]